MTILMFGEDTFRLNKKLEEIVAEYRQKKKGFNPKIFEIGPSGLEDLSSELRQNSMFSEKKFVIVKDAFSHKPFKEQFLKVAKKILSGDDVIIFCQPGKILKSDKLYEYFKKNGEVQEFRPLEQEKLEQWVKNEVAKSGLAISKEALAKLVIYVGNDLWRFSNEIRKLADYQGKAGKEIASGDIDLLVRSQVTVDIFRTIDALGQRDKKTALKLIHGHLEKGDSHFYLFSMINFQFRNLLMVKAKSENAYGEGAAMAGKLEMHPYVLRKTLGLCRRFTLEELKVIYKKIFKIDLQVKTGKLDAAIALDLLIAEI